MLMMHLWEIVPYHSYKNATLQHEIYFVHLNLYVIINSIIQLNTLKIEITFKIN